MIETFSLASSERERKWGKIVKPMVFVSLFLLEQWKTRAFFFLRISIKEKKINLRGKKYLRYSIGWFLWIEKKKWRKKNTWRSLLWNLLLVVKKWISITSSMRLDSTTSLCLRRISRPSKLAAGSIPRKLTPLHVSVSVYKLCIFIYADMIENTIFIMQ